MTEKTKKWLIIGVGCVLCLALVIGIALRFGGEKEPAEVEVTDPPVENIDPVVDIRQPETTTDPGAGADSSGAEQTIQADPVKPDPPEPPVTANQDHDESDVPEEDRNAAQPPEYTEPPVVAPENKEPVAGSSIGAGQVYVPGFGWVQSHGEGKVIHDNTIHENGNKVGIMG